VNRRETRRSAPVSNLPPKGLLNAPHANIEIFKSQLETCAASARMG
jgi:hypothetical protein